MGDERTSYSRICDAPTWLVALVAPGGAGCVEIRLGRTGFAQA
jgi:hypothetical protein